MRLADEVLIQYSKLRASQIKLGSVINKKFIAKAINFLLLTFIIAFIIFIANIPINLLDFT
jgi:large-conductance mechanosensitive channel